MKRLLVALAAAISLGHAWADEALVEAMAQPWTGDLDGMVERRAVRALRAPSRMQYWIDRGRAERRGVRASSGSSRRC